MCFQAKGENTPWGQKAQVPTIKLDSAIACKSTCYLIIQGKNVMRKSENESIYGTTHTHTSSIELYYHIKLQSKTQQLTKRKKKLITVVVFSSLIATCSVEAVGDSKGMLTPTITQKGPYTLVPKQSVMGSSP